MQMKSTTRYLWQKSSKILQTIHDGEGLEKRYPEQGICGKVSCSEPVWREVEKLFKKELQLCTFGHTLLLLMSKEKINSGNLTLPPLAFSHLPTMGKACQLLSSDSRTDKDDVCIHLIQRRHHVYNRLYSENQSATQHWQQYAWTQRRPH